MSASVPVARRMLVAEPRRLSAAAVAVGCAVMVILLLEGLWAGVRAQVTRYEDSIGSDLFVVAPGVRSLFAEGSSIPLSDVEVVERTSGVTATSPILGQFVILDLHGRKVPATLVGAVPGGHGGPWTVSVGREPSTSTEAVVDSILARRHGIDPGDRVTILDRDLVVVGLSSGTASFMTGFVFVTFDGASALLRRAGVASAVLVSTAEAGSVRGRLEQQGLEVLTRADLRSSGLALVDRVFGTPIRLMLAVSFAAGTLIIALTAHTVIVEHQREFGIIKAMGASTTRLAKIAMAQSFAVAAAGFVVGLVLIAAGRFVVVTARPQFEVVITPAAIARTAIATVVMASVAAALPVRRLSRLDPALAYRSE